mmetsp:Transcript_77549/g.161148  ORF Transcript_77549/g.161148 Transcript_77549/m.161148 type:complete len:375 (-) Transcript_77549:119-1243(-)
MPADVASLLQSEDPAARSLGLERLSPSVAAQYSEALSKCLLDADALVRASALRAVEDVGAAATLPGLVEQLESFLKSGKTHAGGGSSSSSSSSSGARCAAALALAAVSPGSEQHAALIAPMLEEESSENFDSEDLSTISCVARRPKVSLRLPKCAAAEALGKLGPAGASYAPAVAKLLNDKSTEVRAIAADALASMGLDATTEEPALLKALQCEKQAKATAAYLNALAQGSRAKGVASYEVVNAIASSLSSPNPLVRAAAVAAMGGAGPQASLHLPKLMKALSDRSPQVKIAVVNALAELGPVGHVYAADVARLAHDEWQLPFVRCAAIDALANMGERGAAFEEEIAELVADSSEEVQDAASRFLQHATMMLTN